MSKHIEITNGPSREELFDALRLCAEKRLVPFSIKSYASQNRNGTTYKAYIQSIEAEDGSGESWNVVLKFQQVLFLQGLASRLCNKPEGLKAYYSSKKRIGIINIK